MLSSHSQKTRKKDTARAGFFMFFPHHPGHNFAPAVSTQHWQTSCPPRVFNIKRSVMRKATKTLRTRSPTKSLGYNSKCTSPCPHTFFLLIVSPMCISSFDHGFIMFISYFSGQSRTKYVAWPFQAKGNTPR